MVAGTPARVVGVLDEPTPSLTMKHGKRNHLKTSLILINVFQALAFSVKIWTCFGSNRSLGGFVLLAYELTLALMVIP
jgi:hypothetical protein